MGIIRRTKRKVTAVQVVALVKCDKPGCRATARLEGRHFDKYGNGHSETGEFWRTEYKELLCPEHQSPPMPDSPYDRPA